MTRPSDDVPDAMPLYLRIAGQLIRQIEHGTYRVGDAIPSVRAGRQLFKVSPGTLQAAYRHLEDRGYIRARPQSGYYVRARSTQSLQPPRSATTANQPRTIKASLAMQVFKQMAVPGVLQLGAAVPDAAFLPVGAINQRLARTMRLHQMDVHRYGPVMGLPQLRERLAHFMAQAGCCVHADELIVTHGCTEAFNLCLRAVTRLGDIVAVESPTYYGLLMALRNLGLKALSIRTCSMRGMDIDALVHAAGQHRIVAVALCPSFANPAGTCMPMDSRRRLVAWAAATGTPIIEDDIYGELHFDETRPTPLHALDRAGQVMYCSSISKTLSPGLRIGWCAPGRYQPQVEELKAASNPTSPMAAQHTLADFLKSGGVQKHLRRTRRLYRHQVDRFCEALTHHWQVDFRLHPPAGGHLLWVELPRRVNTSELFPLALQQGVTFAPGEIFSPIGRLNHCLRLNCAVTWTPAVQRAIQMLGRLIDTHIR